MVLGDEDGDEDYGWFWLICEHGFWFLVINLYRCQHFGREGEKVLQ